MSGHVPEERFKTLQGTCSNMVTLELNFHSNGINKVSRALVAYAFKLSGGRGR